MRSARLLEVALFYGLTSLCLLSRPLSSVVVVPCGINQKIKKRHKGRDSLLSIDAKDDGRTARIGGANPHPCRSQDFIFFQFLKFISWLLMTFSKVANSSIGCPPSDSWEMPSDEFIQSDHHETWFWFIINDIFIRMEFYFRPTWLTKTFYAFHFPRRVFSACTCDALFKRLKKKTRHPYENLTCTHPRSSLRYLMDRRLDVRTRVYSAGPE